MLGERGNNPPTQIARLQNDQAIRSPVNFDKLMRLLTPGQRGFLWCVNLGEVAYDTDQLVRIRKALSEPTCMVTHMFIDPKDLPSLYLGAIDPSPQLLEVQRRTDSGTGNP